jgi:hypothetical protein
MSFEELSTEITSTATAKSLFRIIFLFSPLSPTVTLGPASRACTCTGAPAATLQASAPA